MLATSPSPSASAFGFSAFKNGPGSLPKYPSSPKNSALPPQRSLRPDADSGSCPSIPPSPPSRPNYQDASTQYSPMSEISHPSPRLIRSIPGGNSHREPISRAVPSAGSDAVLPSQDHTVVAAASPALRPQVPSPQVKRRQFRETAESGSSSATVQPTPLKRSRPAKAAAKVLPVRYEFCPVEDMVVIIADMISQLIETNDNLPLRDVVLTRFHSRTPPGISVIDYLHRLAKHATLSPPLLLCIVYYIDRLCSLYPAFSISSLTVHRFLITAATVSAKGLSDSFWNNSTYARVGGIKLAELGLLELEFLYRLDWRIVPNPEVLVEYYHGLVGRSGDYVLEGGVDAANHVGSNSMGDDITTPQTMQTTAEEENLSTDATGMKWDKWMKDVADSSASQRRVEEEEKEHNAP